MKQHSVFLPTLLAILPFVLARAQERIPRPLVYGGFTLSNGGFAPLGQIGGARLEVGVWRFLVIGDASYSNVRKVNDNTGLNPKGREREAAAQIRLRIPHYWFVGATARWGDLSTSNYQKSSWHPGVGGGRDFLHLRLDADYLFAGSDLINGSQGILTDLFFPSPSRSRSHWFYRDTVEVYRAHGTVTAPSDPITTARELATHSWGTVQKMTVVFRF